MNDGEQLAADLVAAYGPPLNPSLIEAISEAYHVARCSHPDECPAKCPWRMPVDLAVAVFKAVAEHPLSMKTADAIEASLRDSIHAVSSAQHDYAPVHDYQAALNEFLGKR